jgi:hypothetical protein
MHVRAIRSLMVGTIMAIGAFGLADAADKNAKFMVGGGIGSFACASFLNAMATARHDGGVHTTGGASEVIGYLYFVEGFSDCLQRGQRRRI